MLILTFKYAPRGYRTTYTAAHVNILFSAVQRNYPGLSRFLCITDDPTGIKCETLPLWSAHRQLLNPSHSTARPNCYPRLRCFGLDFAELIGAEEFTWLDLDTAIVGDITPVVERPEDLVIFDAKGDGRYQGSIVKHRCGTRPQLWSDFDPVKSPQATVKAGLKGSDQAWIRLKCPGEAVWTKKDGVQSFMQLIPARKDRQLHRHEPKWPAPRDGSLPEGTRIVSFAGGSKPWDQLVMQRSPWLHEHYR